MPAPSACSHLICSLIAASSVSSKSRRARETCCGRYGIVGCQLCSSDKASARYAPLAQPAAGIRYCPSFHSWAIPTNCQKQDRLQLQIESIYKKVKTT